jgi:Bacterial TniB protein
MASPTTKEEWRKFCNYEPTPDAQRPSLNINDIKALSPHDKAAYNERRIDYINEQRVLKTRDLNTILALARKSLRANRVESYVARRGIRISGAYRMGKSTAVTAAGARLEIECRRADNRESDPSYLPVIYTTIAAASTTNKLWVRLANFVGARDLRGKNADERLIDLAHLLRELGTKFVILDDVQRLNTSNRPGAEVADNIKVFAESLDATMIFTGVSLDTAPLFSGDGGAQWRKRTRPVYMSNYQHNNATDFDEWQRLIAGFERLLPLPLHEHGLLESNADYLFHRTGGSLATLSDLIKDAAEEAIDQQTEAITLRLLDTISVEPEVRGEHDAP